MIDRMIITEIASLLKTDLEKINGANGYHFSYKKIYHNIQNINKETEYPFIRYMLQSDRLISLDESQKLEQREVTLTFVLTHLSSVDTDNTNDLTLTAYRMREDVMGYMGMGDWIRKDCQQAITELRSDFGGDAVIRPAAEYSDPYYSRDNTEVEIQVNFIITYFQKLN